MHPSRVFLIRPLLLVCFASASLAAEGPWTVSLHQERALAIRAVESRGAIVVHVQPLAPDAQTDIVLDRMDMFLLASGPPVLSWSYVPRGTGPESRFVLLVDALRHTYRTFVVGPGEEDFQALLAEPDFQSWLTTWEVDRARDVHGSSPQPTTILAENDDPSAQPEIIPRWGCSNTCNGSGSAKIEVRDFIGILTSTTTSSGGWGRRDHPQGGDGACAWFGGGSGHCAPKCPTLALTCWTTEFCDWDIESFDGYFENLTVGQFVNWDFGDNDKDTHALVSAKLFQAIVGVGASYTFQSWGEAAGNLVPVSYPASGSSDC